jgi:hypothetical protein
LRVTRPGTDSSLLRAHSFPRQSRVGALLAHIAAEERSYQITGEE